MTGKELKELVDSGIIPMVEFTDLIEDLELRFEEGMRAYVTKVNIVYNNEVEILVEEKDLADYNKLLEKPIWRKETNGDYIYKFSELKNENFNGVVDFGEMLDEELCDCFVLDDEKIKLFNKYKFETNNKISYMNWLEDIILNCNLK